MAEQSDVGEDRNFVDVVVTTDGRLLAANMTDGVRLFDLESGDELAIVPQASKRIAIQSDGALVTNGNLGLLRWPLREMKARSLSRTMKLAIVGLPSKSLTPSTTFTAGRQSDRDRRTVAKPQNRCVPRPTLNPSTASRFPRSRL